LSVAYPPGHPGIPPTWASSAKNGVGTAIARESRIWFTITQGIVSELYYPELDQANTRVFRGEIADQT
jgi:glucoamylase